MRSTKKFLKAKGEKSTNAESDLEKVGGFFAKIKDRKAKNNGSEEDNFLSDLIDGTANKLEMEGENLLTKMITGADAADETPVAPKQETPAAAAAAETTPGKMNIALIIGAAVVLYFLMKRR